MLYWLIPVGVILVLSIIILIGIILESNQLVVLKNNVDRKFPLMNMKLKEYMEEVANAIALFKGVAKNREDFLKVEQNYNKLKKSEGFAKRLKIYKDLKKSVGTLTKDLTKSKEIKKSKKADAIFTKLKEIEKQIDQVKQKYNECATKYNQKREKFPAKMFAERFNFEEKVLW